MEFALIVAVIATGFLVVLALTNRYLRTLRNEIACAREAFDRASERHGSPETDLLKAHGDATCAEDVRIEGGGAEALAERALAYNNLVATYANATRTFPATLVARRHNVAYEPIDPAWVERTLGTSYASERMPDASRIMNPYMLWAAGMGDIALEDVERTD